MIWIDAKFECDACGHTAEGKIPVLLTGVSYAQTDDPIMGVYAAPEFHSPKLPEGWGWQSGITRDGDRRFTSDARFRDTQSELWCPNCIQKHNGQLE